jgi:hypothetical protein
MKVHFLGATRTTTGSMYLLEVNGQRLLLEPLPGFPGDFSLSGIEI